MATVMKCPRCREQSFTLYERLEVAHVFRVDAGNARPMAISEDMPVQLGFSAACDCGHRWVPRHSTALSVMDAERAALRQKEGK